MFGKEALRTVCAAGVAFVGSVAHQPQEMYRGPLLAQDHSWSARADNTTYDWQGKYCVGIKKTEKETFSVTCDGKVATFPGYGRANQGESITCPDRFIVFPILDCTIENDSPPIIEIHTVYPSIPELENPQQM